MLLRQCPSTAVVLRLSDDAASEVAVWCAAQSLVLVFPPAVSKKVSRAEKCQETGKAPRGADSAGPRNPATGTEFRN